MTASGAVMLVGLAALVAYPVGGDMGVLWYAAPSNNFVATFETVVTSVLLSLRPA